MNSALIAVSNNNTKFSIPNLSIFTNINQQSNQCSDYKQCCSIQRLLSSLKYYTMIKPQSATTENKSIFGEFIMDIYKQEIIDDFNHLTHKHGQQLHLIMDYALTEFDFGGCDLDKCNYSNRHYRVNNHDDTKTFPTELVYYDILDGIHYYLFHLFHSGFRTVDDHDVKIECIVENDKEYYDSEFAKRINVISNTRMRTNRFDRISSNHGNKYCIKDENNSQYNDKDENVSNDMDTYLDSLYQHLFNVNIPDDVINRFRQFIISERYDSVSLELDIPKSGEYESNGNIAGFMNDMKCVDAVVGHLNDIRGMQCILCMFCF